MREDTGKYVGMRGKCGGIWWKYGEYTADVRKKRGYMREVWGYMAEVWGYMREVRKYGGVFEGSMGSIQRMW